jgi:hypothetical protein
MENFVDIKTCFGSNNERTIESLQRLYNDDCFLQNSITDLLLRHLKPENFENKKVLLKPNWVKHSVYEFDEICLRTNNNFLLALLEVILKFKPTSVLIGDAPIQGCKWQEVVTENFISRVESLSNQYKVSIKIKDFRRVIFNPIQNSPIKDRSPLSDYVIFDLGNDSYLEPITSSKKNLFRVADYNPDRLAESHGPGVHKYCITKELFEADIVISVPKVKTHQKAGITAALKNLVGVNGDKDYLPHHRVGGVEQGGDCYPGKNRLRFWSELAVDFANRHQGTKLYWVGRKVSSAFWYLSLPKKNQNLGAAWFGNDTTWRMVLDLNKVAIFGLADGTISKNPQRQLFSFCDGIIGGQGDGPLKPEPIPLGIISFTNYSGVNDLAMATLMGFDIQKVAMLNEIVRNTKNEKVAVFLNSELTDLKKLVQFSYSAKVPPGWENYKNSL